MVHLSELEWDKKYEVGHKKIDFEHQIFLDLLKSLGQLLEDDSDKDKTERVLAEIRKYADFHFLSEENIMIDIGFKGFHEHKELHATLLKDLDRLIASYKEGKETVSYLIGFLFLWFANHTTGVDIKISEYINSHQ